MKKSFLTILAILFTAVIFLNSCEEVQELVGSLSFTKDGETWTSVEKTTTIKDGDIIIQAAATNKEAIVITIKGTSTGTYEQSLASLTPKNECFAVIKNDLTTADADGYASFSGTVDLDEYNSSTKRVSGTFEFILTKTELTLSDTLHVTNGIFENLRITSEQ